MIQVGIHYNDIQQESRLKYTIAFLNNHPIFSQYLKFIINKTEKQNIYYGIENKNGYYVPKLNLLFSKKEINPLSLVSNTFAHNSNKLHGIGKTKNSGIESFENERQNAFDIFETIFFHISRIEEHNPADADLNDRGLLDESVYFVIRNEISKEPVVDNIVTTLIEIFCKIQLSQKPEIIVTHDIDHIKMFTSKLALPKKIVGSIIRGKFANIKNLIAKHQNYTRNGHDPYDVFEWMLDKNKREKYIFYLVGGEHIYDTPIPKEDLSFIESISIALSRKYEIGIHPSFESSQKPDLITEEKRLLENVSKVDIKVSRQHYLQFDIHRSINMLLEAGIQIDLSLGFNQSTGFRCGTGFRYFLYDFDKEEASALAEIPLVFMDSAMMKESSFDSTKCKKEAEHFLNLRNTCICINFHNSRFEDALSDGIDLRNIYNSFLNA